MNTYDLTNNSTACQYYRLDVTRNIGNGITQLAELQLWADDVIIPARKKSADQKSSAPSTRTR